jgi:putative ABC transport system permease protein
MRRRHRPDHAEEAEFFIQQETEENIARGMPAEEARRAAVIKYGNRTAVREEVYLMGRFQLLDTLLRDLRYAARVLRGAPTFTLVSLATLALGIGATTAIFTVVNGVILQPLPFRDPSRLVTIWETNPLYKLPGNPAGAINFSPGNYLDLRDQSRAYEQMGALATGDYNLTGAGAPDRVTGALVSASLLNTLGIHLPLGRAFDAAEDTPGGDRVAIVSHRFWLEHFGGDAGVIGKAIRLDDRPHTIVGVMPAGFRLLTIDADVWLPIERKIAPNDMRWRSSYYIRVIGRLKPGVTLAQAQLDADRVIQAIFRVAPADLGKGALVMPMLENTVARARGPLFLLLGAVSFVLLIACANVANLNLGRAVKRRREIAVRLALGASRGRLIGQLLTESLALAIAGAALGLVFAQWGVSALLKIAPNQIPRAADIRPDVYVFGFTTLIASAAAILFGLYPALAASKPELQRAMSTMPAAQRARGVLVAAEIALALVLMIGAGLLIESFLRVRSTQTGFDPRNLVTVRVPLSTTRYPAIEKQNAFYRALFDRVRAIPGLESAGAIDGLPFSGGGFDNAFEIDGRPPLPPGQFLMADIRRVDTNYFSTMRIPLAQGRTFQETDRTGAPPVVAISQSLANKYWPNESAVGKRLTVDYGPAGGIRAEIVGVIGDVRPAFDSTPAEIIYLHYPQGIRINEIHLVLRSNGTRPVANLIQDVRAAVGSLDPDQPVYRVRSMDDLLSASLATRRFETSLLALFAGLAALLAAVGLYGVIAYSVQSRTREIGIRTTLGANRGQVFAMIMKQGLRLTAIGILAGLAGALALTRLLASLLFEVSAIDPATYAVISLLLIAIAAVATLLPARLATRVDPMTALRVD